MRLFSEYGGPDLADKVEFLRNPGRSLSPRTADPEASLDDFAACGIEHPEDIRELFVRRFYFGCESDHPINAWAFNAKANPFNARLGAVFGSDIGHFDVQDMTEVLHEAYELVEEGLITDTDFRDFVFTNPVRLWTANNPHFFKGTAVEKQVSTTRGRIAREMDFEVNLYRRSAALSRAKLSRTAGLRTLIVLVQWIDDAFGIGSFMVLWLKRPPRQS
jgi:hypothetical protein